MMVMINADQHQNIRDRNEDKSESVKKVQYIHRIDLVQKKKNKTTKL